MQGFFSEHCHIVNGIVPAADAFAGGVASDIVNLKLYSGVTFLIMTGASTTAAGVVTVQAGTSVSAATNAVPFKYRTILAPATTNVPSALTQATSSGFTITASKANSFYIVEVLAEDLLAGGYSTCKLNVTEPVDDPQAACVVAILHGPRYDATQSAIV